MKKIISGLKIISVLVLALVLFSCNPVERATNSGSFLIIESIIGKDTQGNDSTVVFSDIITNGMVYSDFVNLTVRAATLDPNPIMGVSQYSDVMITNYIVTYIRSDGATGEGTDVPYHIEGTMSTLVPVGSSVSIPLLIVRDVAKTQPPLSTLGTGVLECTARIELIGHDLRNRQVKQTGQITVRFADYVDQQ
ncbi:MAG: hypothetical protein QHH43_05730 [Candidatus Saccharicenans sp.]|jgi:hypothetical protein|nr:hypothetical protein [Candidatus Saccharicenans sp.]MDH7575242.1 hypothetical protein [Candidatus Saccharicenans sp.]